VALFDRVDDDTAPPVLATPLDAFGTMPPATTLPPAPPRALPGMMAAPAPQEGLGGRERLMRALTMLAPMIAGIIAQARNKNPYGSGTAQGLVMGAANAGEMFQQQDEQRRQQQVQEETRRQQAADRETKNAMEAQRFAMEQQRFLDQRGQQRATALDSVAKGIAGFDTKEDYDAYIDRIGTALQQGGHRDLGPNQLRVLFPFVAPTAAKRAQKVLDAFLKNPINQGMLQKAEQLPSAKIAFDVDGDGIAETIPLPRLFEIAQQPLAVDDQGKAIVYPKGTTKEDAVDAQGRFEGLLKQAAAEGKDITDEKLKDALRDQALKKHRDATTKPDKPSGAKGRTDELADAVMANPELWDSLTPSGREKIAPILAERGFTQFGKAMPATAVKQIADSRSAVESLKDLREVLKKNEQYIGPIAGLSAMNPYSEARKAQADIDRVRQRVGKALEGGVLRKEDEEKYKKILATLRDVPETAIYKIDQLIQDIERDIQTFMDAQRQSGRRTGEPTPAPTGAAEQWERGPDGKLRKKGSQ
jgi:hypothetical protein